jgi:putative hydrolase of the HAD superfamily
MNKMKAIIFDWGDTVMRDFPEYTGPMAYWPQVEPVEGIDDALKQLQKSFICYLASNAGDSDAALVAAALSRVNLRQYFRYLFTSHELGVKKPDPAFYREILSRITLKPEQCAAVGNDYTKGYMLMLKDITLKRGIPLALYHDRHSIFEVVRDKEASLEEQLAGSKPLTQIGRLLNELGINSIAANSPEAKGRIERLWKTFQDRLTSELRLAGANNRETANQILKSFLPEYNQRFRVSPRETGSAYRKPKAGFKPNEYFCYKYPRTVGTDNVVRFVNHRLQILSNPERSSYARCKVQVYAGLNGTLAVYYRNQCLDTCPAPLESTRLRVTRQSIPRIYSKVPSSHPWKGKFRTYFD